MNSREKGKVGEREWAEWLRNRGLDARRGQQNRGGADSPDVIGGWQHTHCEVKRREALNIHAAIDQAKTEAPVGSVPYVAHRRNGKAWLITIDAEDVWMFALAVVNTPRGNVETTS